MPCRAVDNRRHKRRDRIEIMFGRLKDWPRVATRDDRDQKAPSRQPPSIGDQS